MRMKGNELEAQLKSQLSEKPRLPPALEAALFARAEELLGARRERLHARKSSFRRSAQDRTRRLGAARRLNSRVLEVFSIHPDAPATAAALAALVLAFLALHGGNGNPSKLTYSDLPALPKGNDAPARYDAQRLAEQQAYEREVEDAHQKTSGGI